MDIEHTRNQHSPVEVETLVYDQNKKSLMILLNILCINWLYEKGRI